jgi:hypothetical protein
MMTHLLTPAQREDFEVLSEQLAGLNGYAQILKRRWDEGSLRLRPPPKLRKALEEIGKRLSDLAAMADQVERQVELVGETCCKSHRQTKDLLTEGEIAGLLRLNHRLSDLEHHLTEVALELTPRLEAKLADSNDRMADYEIDATLQFLLREDDVFALDENILTVRKERLKDFQAHGLADNRDHREPCRADMAQLGKDRHCWLFHDLYDHGYGLTAPRVPLRDCLRIGKVWIDVVIQQQYCLNVDTGEWTKWV